MIWASLLPLLLDLGSAAEPEYTLRASYTLGAVHHFRIETTHRVDGVKTSNLTAVLRQRVLEVRAGSARLEIRLEQILFGKDDPRAPLFAHLNGAAWRGWVDQRGGFKELRLVPPPGLPPLLRPLVKELDRVLPGHAVPLPAGPVRVGDTWTIPADQLGGSGDAPWARGATGALTCRLESISDRRAVITAQLRAELGKNSSVQGSGRWIIHLDGGWLEEFSLKSRLRLRSTIAGGNSEQVVDQDYRLSGRQENSP
jgi:hypothetical protein